jgi:hypothetical protein
MRKTQRPNQNQPEQPPEFEPDNAICTRFWTPCPAANGVCKICGWPAVPMSDEQKKSQQIW